MTRDNVKMKSSTDIIRGFVKSLPDSDMYELCDRLNKNYQDDLANGLLVIQKSSDVDRLLSSVNSSGEFFEIIDAIHSQLENEKSRKHSFYN